MRESSFVTPGWEFMSSSGTWNNQKGVHEIVELTNLMNDTGFIQEQVLFKSNNESKY